MSRTPLVCIKTLEQLAELESEHPRLLESAELVALSPHVYLRLRESGRAVTAASELLTDDELRTIPVAARTLARSWFAPIESDLEYRGLNLGELVRFDQIRFCRELLAARAAASRILSDRRPDEVWLYARGTTACVRSHRITGRHDVCEGVLQHELARAAVRVVDLEASRRPAAGVIPVAWKRKVLRTVRWVTNGGAPSSAVPDQVVWPPSLEHSSISGRTVLAMGEEVDLLTLQPLVATLRDSGRYRAVLVDIAGERADVSGRAGLQSFDEVEMFDLAGLAAVTKEGQAAIARLPQTQRRFHAAKPTHPDAIEGLVRSPYLGFHFEWFSRRLWPDLIRHIDRASAVLERLRPEAVLVAGAEQCRDRATVRLARRAGIATLAVPHGSIEDVDHFDFEADHLLAWGTASRELLISELGKAPESIAVVGPLHFGQLVSATRGRAPLPDRPRPTLLIITARISPVCYDGQSHERFRETWAAVATMLDRRPDVDVVIKPHPGGSDLVAWYQEFCAQRPNSNARVVTGQRLEDLASSIDGAVIMFSFTTAALVLLAVDVPTIFVQSAWRGTSTAFHLDQSGDFETVEEVSAVATCLERLVDDQAFKARCQERGRRTLGRSVTTPSAKQVVAVFDQLFAGRARPATVSMGTA